MRMVAVYSLYSVGQLNADNVPRLCRILPATILCSFAVHLFAEAGSIPRTQSLALIPIPICEDGIPARVVHVLLPKANEVVHPAGLEPATF